MSRADEGRRGSRRFDAFGLVARRGHLEGQVDPFDLDRVQDILGQEEDGTIPEANVAWGIDGESDATGREVLHVTLDGEVPLACQRCMRTFAWTVHQRTTVLLAHDEEELAYLDEHDEREVILATAPLDPLAVVEDELVLSLPYVPRCERQDCHADDPVPSTGEGSEATPFAALAGMKKARTPGDG